ncbi:hypothetical protein EE612_016842, partial [Oryza sativa]
TPPDLLARTARRLQLRHFATTVRGRDTVRESARWRIRWARRRGGSSSRRRPCPWRRGKSMAERKTPEGGEGDGDVNVGGGVETDGDGGFLTTMASKIGAAMSGGNGNGRAEEEEGGEHNGDENVVAASGGGEEERKRKRDGNGGGGIFSKLMSGSPDSLPASGRGK